MTTPEGPIDISKMRAKIEERRAKEAAKKAAEIAASKAQHPSVFDGDHAADLVPEATPRSEEDKELDEIISSVDIIDGYNRWCGKMRPEPRPGQTEGVKISCPTPDHRDSDPSAWINTENQTWFCGGCQIGGDVLDIAAYHFNYPVPGYKQGAKFHELRRDMAKSMGYTFHKLLDGKVYAEAPSEPEPPVAPTAPAAPASPSGEHIAPADMEPSEEGEAKVIELFDEIGMDDDITFPSLDWREIVPEDTFLDAYMKATIVDDVPEEYHFWNGLLALGLALGRDVRLYDLVPVYGNLFVCTLGHSGSGKSKARYHLDQLLTKALPYSADDPNSRGVKKVNTPASAEVLVQSFQKPVTDPANPKIVLYNAPVKGIVDFNELSSLVGRANRTGNVLKPTLMQFYDMENTISTVSLTSGTKEAKDPFSSALTTTQPRALRELLGRQDDSSGFLNRWVFAAGPEKQRFAIGGVRVDVTAAIPLLDEVSAYADTFPSDDFVQWSPEAAQLFTDFFHKVIEPDKKRSTSELITRIDLTMKKLILLFTANRKHKTVPEEVVEEAMKCYPYIMACYSIPAEQIGNSLQNEMREAVGYQAQKWQEKHPQGITMSELARSLKRRKYPMDLLKKTIELMVAFGELNMTVDKKGVGRPTERFSYVG